MQRHVYKLPVTSFPFTGSASTTIRRNSTRPHSRGTECAAERAARRMLMSYSRRALHKSQAFLSWGYISCLCLASLHSASMWTYCLLFCYIHSFAVLGNSTAMFKVFHPKLQYLSIQSEENESTPAFNSLFFLFIGS